MYPSLVLSAALVVPAAPVPRDTAPNTSGPAPRVIALKADATGTVRITGSIPTKVTVTNTHFVIENVVENGKQVQKQVQKQVEQDIVTSQYFSKTLSEFNGKFTTADGTALTLEEATARVKNGATLLASSDGKPIAPSWLRAVGKDTVVMVADGLSHAQMQWGGAPMPMTPAPRLAVYGADANGKVVAPCTSQPISQNNGYYYDEMAFEGRAFRGRGGFDGGYYGPQPSTATVVNKPLGEVKFDAYDVNGKLVPKSEVLKRLAAGGMVLVAGDNRLPDETYLKAFKDDVLVLVGPELVLPIPPVDQTKKKDGKPMIPMAIPAIPAIQVRPVIVNPAVKPAAILKAAKAGAVEEKKAEEPKAEEKKPDEKKPEEKK
jgi:hypothetical protein